MPHNQRNSLLAVLLTMLVLEGCSAPKKKQTPEALRKEAYEALNSKNGIPPTPQEMKKAMHKFVDNMADEAIQALMREKDADSSRQQLSLKQYKEKLKKQVEGKIDEFSSMTQEELKQSKKNNEVVISLQEKKLKDLSASDKEKDIARETIELMKFGSKCIENFIK